MYLELLCDENNEWGFKEIYKTYKGEEAGRGYVYLVVGFDGEDLSEPYLYRSGELVSMSDDMTMNGINTPTKRRRQVSQYISSKETYYSLLKGNIILELKIWFDLDVLRIKPMQAVDYENSTAEFYKPLKYYPEQNVLDCQKIDCDNEDRPAELNDILEEICIRVASSQMDKATYLYDRTIIQKQKKTGRV